MKFCDAKDTTSKSLTMSIRQSSFTVKHVHDLIVADLLMPDSLGLDFMTQLLRRNPDARILAIAGGELIHSESQWNAASVFGSVRVLRKPFSLAAFLRIVKEQLSQERSSLNPSEGK